jgi:phospholipid/cholesterol/gamma-HCH transport system permease protein
LSSTGLSFSGSGSDTLRLELSGSWKLADALPSIDDVRSRLQSETGLRSVTFDTERISAWDSGLVNFLIGIIDYCSSHDVTVDQEGLPRGVRGLLKLAYGVPEQKGARREAKKESLLINVGNQTIDAVRSTGQFVTFLGEATLATRKFLQGKAHFRRSDMFLIMQQAGAEALPIVSLVSFLLGVIMAYLGAAQLAKFGAAIYVANLVGLSMARETAPIMTAIVLAGRTGAAFAAQLGTMNVNEEIDALRTLGIAPMEFLVVPRMLALMLMLPLLVIYSCLMGIVGGAFVAVAGLGITLTEYLVQTQAALTMTDVASGLFKAVVYGAIVAVTGCLRGMQCGRSAADVGAAATSAVVTAIVLIIAACAVLTVIYDVLGI